jgi:aryl-alcohol dehydrogenase-like predicted oxidoreductase
MMEHRRLGRTEHRSTVAIFGAACVARATPDEAEAAFADALARGVNHVDVAPRYGDAEVLLGPLVEPVRDSLFLACKTTRRDPDGVRAQLEESLRRLHTDRFDLYQLHGVTDPEVLAERARAAEVILRARDEGVVRFAGITGHDHRAPAAFREALRRYDLDTVMLPVNARMWADAAYRADAEALLETCAERDLGVMAIKAVARRPWGDGERFATTWYEPFTDADAIARAVSFTLSISGVHALCTPGDMDIAREAMDAAVGFAALGPDERDAMIEAAADVPSIFPIPA